MVRRFHGATVPGVRRFPGCDGSTVRQCHGNGGLVFGLSMFRHPLDEKTLSKTLTILNPDGTRSQRPMNFEPFDFESAHVIKVRNNRIHGIEAMGIGLPHFSTNGWSDLPR